jgi:hypothetical protein
MKTNFPAGIPQVEAEIAELEARLQAALQPVEPRNGFVRDLRQQLITNPEGPDDGRQFSSKNLLMIFASVIGGAVLLIFGARGIKSLLQAMGRMNDEKVTVPANPV